MFLLYLSITEFGQNQHFLLQNENIPISTHKTFSLNILFFISILSYKVVNSMLRLIASFAKFLFSFISIFTGTIFLLISLIFLLMSIILFCVFMLFFDNSFISDIFINNSLNKSLYFFIGIHHTILSILLNLYVKIKTYAAILNCSIGCIFLCFKLL